MTEKSNNKVIKIKRQLKFTHIPKTLRENVKLMHVKITSFRIRLKST